ncbi:TPA: toprim domain-containing protein [Morganella morganii]|nr:toprim domain-containing protein [Morganella morganii]
MRTVEAVRGRWPEIFEYYQLPPVTGKKHYQGECPVCGKKGKFRIDNKNDAGSWICSCGAGDGWKLLELTQQKDFKILAGEIDKLIGNSYSEGQRRPQTQSDTKSTRSKVIAKFGTLIPLKDTDAHRYLMSRGINTLPAGHIRFNPREATPMGVKQSIWSIATDDRGNGCYLHRTVLEGDKKASFEGNKRLLKLQEDNYLDFAGSIAIRMTPVASTLGIAEGIETALSCQQIYGCNTWSTLNANFMRKFRAPKGVTHLIIFADADSNGTGLAAAFECGNRNILSPNDVEKVSIRWIDGTGDFNDMLINGAKVFQQELWRKRTA